MTARKRSIIAGMTDYTGVPMDVILSDFRDWRDNTTRSIEKLKQLKGTVEAHKDRLDWPDAKLAHIDYFIGLFGRYLGDFRRLLAEVPRGVRNAHIRIVQQIGDSAFQQQKRSVQFKKDHIECSLKDEDLRWLVDNIYCESQEMLIDYWDLSNLTSRLRTFVGATMETPSGSDAERYFAVKEEQARAARGNAKVTAALPPKKMNFGRWMDEADLTERQRHCFSLRTEYGLSVSEISRRLGISRPSVDKHIAAANRKINQVHANDSSARKSLAKRKSE